MAFTDSVRRSRPGVSLAALAMLLASCSGGTEEAKRGVDEFRARAAQRSFQEIYRSATPEFQRAATEEQFLRFMAALDRRLGAWESAEEPVWNATRGTGGHFVNLTYQSQFAKGPATEQFAWRIEHGAPRLLGYNVNSPLLITD